MGGGGSSRPWDKGSGVSKIFFQPFGPHFGRKIRGGPSPGSATATLAILIPPFRLFEQAIFLKTLQFCWSEKQLGIAQLR